MDQQMWTQIMCRIAFGPFQSVHHPAGGASFWVLYTCCRSKYSKFDGKTCFRSFTIADSIKMSLASSTLPCATIQRGESGIHLHKMIKANVGQDMAIYKCDQLLKSLAITGNMITPIDQNCSKRVVIMVFGFPDVISETWNNETNRQLKNWRIEKCCWVRVTLKTTYISSIQKYTFGSSKQPKDIWRRHAVHMNSPCRSCCHKIFELSFRRAWHFLG